MDSTIDYIYDLLHQVKDPEIPILSIVDLGIVRNVEISGSKVFVTITPTYTGCPAMDFINVNIKATLQEKGFSDIVVQSVLSPAWTTDWISESGKEKLKSYGIAPPQQTTSNKSVLFASEVNIECPRCNSDNTELISQFGSTACKALYKCLNCKELFDYFKCH
ncbi:MAG: phenylacetate-CoA oxygenase subunit PaaJ [Saprospiraceae bacterium]|nr:phenylacetate-CoA oxygenase subunit PaaJ [Saprospiraceae bacterium]